MKNEALEKFETNLEKAKRLTKDNAAIKGIDLPDDNYFFKMLELAATPDKKTCVGKPDSDTSGGLHLACVSGMLPLSKEHPCFDKGHSMYLVIEIDNGRSKYGDHRCSRCGHTEPFQYDY